MPLFGVGLVAAAECSLAELKARLTALEVGREADHKLCDERDRRYEQRATSQDSAVAMALKASELAQTKSDQGLEKRLDNLNELRQMMIDQTAQFARSDMMHSTFKALEDRMQGLADLVHQNVSRTTGVQQAWGYLVAIAGLGIAVAAMIFK